MRLPRLEIRSQLGALDTRTRNAKLEGTGPDLKVSMSGNAGAEIGIKTTHPRVMIDNTDSLETVGIMSPARFMEKFAARSNQKAIEQIGRIAREGLECMRIERGGSGEGAIARIARDKRARPPVVLEVAEIPNPKISVQMGEVDVQDLTRPVQISTYETADTQSYTPGEVTVTWAVRPSIDISVVPGVPPQGVFVDALV